MPEYGNVTVVSKGGSTTRGFIIGLPVGFFIGVIVTVIYVTSIMYGS
jgi:uncharacterized membrane protein (DUF485 family)